MKIAVRQDQEETKCNCRSNSRKHCDKEIIRLLCLVQQGPAMPQATGRFEEELEGRGRRGNAGLYKVGFFCFVFFGSHDGDGHGGPHLGLEGISGISLRGGAPRQRRPAQDAGWLRLMAVHRCA